ncbi:MAG: hypothetical protein C5B59_15650 [Bacteroidetes bacterium]|nr:MAG: hypothetical protein C5B59_15650 [Bacteroidota bacterium]
MINEFTKEFSQNGLNSLRLRKIKLTVLCTLSTIQNFTKFNIQIVIHGKSVQFNGTPFQIQAMDSRNEFSH